MLTVKTYYDAILPAPKAQLFSRVNSKHRTRSAVSHYLWSMDLFDPMFRFDAYFTRMSVTMLWSEVFHKPECVCSKYLWILWINRSMTLLSKSCEMSPPFSVLASVNSKLFCFVSMILKTFQGISMLRGSLVDKTSLFRWHITCNKPR